MIRPGENLTIVGTIPSTFDMGAYPDVVTDVLNRWLFNSRQMTVEPVAYDKLYSLAEAYQSDALTKRLASFKTSQRERIATGRAADIKIVAIQPLAGSQGHSWEIDWRETIYTIQGYEIPEESGLFHATVRVVQLPPAPITAAGLYQNPLRIYIDEFLPQQRTQGH
jgi:type IV secretory pathway TrbF-like protein